MLAQPDINKFPLPESKDLPQTIRTIEEIENTDNT